jgi:hypothetical protein
MQKFELQVDPRSLRVDIGMPVGSAYLPFPTAASLFDTAKVCEARGIKTRMISPVGCSIVTDARSAVVDEFLKGDATHLFWIDSDIHWHPNSFLRLLTLATAVDVVGATYPLKCEPIRFVVRELGERLLQYGLVEVSGLGLGFTVMKREVVEKVADDRPLLITNGGKTPVREVFELRRTEDGHRIGEDIAFFDDVRAAGYKVWLDPMVNLAHVGVKLYQGDVQSALTLASWGKDIRPVHST